MGDEVILSTHFVRLVDSPGERVYFIEVAVVKKPIDEINVPNHAWEDEYRDHPRDRACRSSVKLSLTPGFIVVAASWCSTIAERIGSLLI